MRSTLMIFIVLFVSNTCLYAQQYLSWANLSGYGSTSAGGPRLNTETDAAGNVYAAGTFAGTIDVDPGTGVFTLTSNGGDDFYLIKYNATGAFVWAISIGGTGNDYYCTIAIDPTGNPVIAGSFTGFIDFDPGPGIYNLASQAADIFIIKLNPAGGFLSAIQVGGSAEEEVRDCHIDASGNIYLSGGFNSTFVDFDPGVGVFTLSKGIGYLDGYVLKLNSNGDFVWANQFKSTSSTGYTTVLGIGADLSGNVLATGIFQGMVDFNTGAGTLNFTAQGLFDGFLAKADAAGNFVWAKHIVNSPGISELGRNVTTDGSGNIYVSGRFDGTVDFDPGPGVVNLTSEGFGDDFITKYTPSGNLIWAKAFSGSGECSTLDLCLDPAGSNLHIVGQFSGGICDFDPGAGTYLVDPGAQGLGYVCTLTSTGSFVSAKIFTGNEFSSCHSISMKDGCEMVIGGVFGGSIDAEPGSNNYTLNAGAVGINFFTLRLNQSLWTGNVSTDWHNPLNWECNTVPGVQSNVTIPTGVPRYPIVSANAEIKSLTVHPAASIQVQSTVEMKVNGKSN